MDLHIDIEDFSGADVVELLKAVASAIPSLEQRIAARTGSNPRGTLPIDSNSPAIFPFADRYPNERSTLGTKFAADGSALPDDAPDWVAARDPLTNIIWMRDDVPGGRRNWAHANAAAAAVTLCGWTWRAPTVEESLTLLDYKESDPAVRKQMQALLRIQSELYWTSTEAWSSDYARCVYFSSGLSDWGSRGNGFFVRAVRVGQ